MLTDTKYLDGNGFKPDQMKQTLMLIAETVRSSEYFHTL